MNFCMFEDQLFLFWLKILIFTGKKIHPNSKKTELTTDQSVRAPSSYNANDFFYCRKNSKSEEGALFIHLQLPRKTASCRKKTSLRRTLLNAPNETRSKTKGLLTINNSEQNIIFPKNNMTVIFHGWKYILLISALRHGYQHDKFIVI